MARTGFPIVGLVVVALAIAACGGDDSGGVDGGPAFDAGPPDAPVATGYTASGAYAGALALARTEHADATLFEVTSARIDANGEVDPEVLQSFWSFSFASLSTGVRINVIYLQDGYNTSLSTVNPEGLKTLPPEWMDSDEAMSSIVSAGFTPPSDAYTTVAMKLNMEELLQDCADPVWEIEKISAEPGQPVSSERWYALYCTSLGSNVACNPDGDCTQL